MEKNGKISKRGGIFAVYIVEEFWLLFKRLFLVYPPRLRAGIIKILSAYVKRAVFIYSFVIRTSFDPLANLFQFVSTVAPIRASICGRNDNSYPASSRRRLAPRDIISCA